MAGWTLVPETPQVAPNREPEGWTPVGSTNAQGGAPAPQESAFSELMGITGHELLSGPLESARLLTSLIHAKMTGSDSSFAYEHYKEYDDHMRSVAADYDAQVSRAAKIGAQETPLAMLIRGKSPEPFDTPDLLLNFVHDISSIYTDPTFLLPMGIGKALGFAKLGVWGGFGLSAGLRKTLMDHYQKGDIQSAGELAGRAGGTIWEAAKGVINAEVMMRAGGIPVGKFISQSPVAATLLKGLYQSTAMTIAGGILDWQVPHLKDFERNAVLISATGLMTHSAEHIYVKQALMDSYAKNGTTPKESVDHLGVQPPVKATVERGIKPAIRITSPDGSKQVISGEDTTHSDLAERVTGNKPIGIDELEANPELADKVLSQPEIQVQQVIDRAYEIKAESGEATTEIPSGLKSGRGFTTDGKNFLNREQAKRWVKENEPEVYEMWKQVVGGEKTPEGKRTEFHSQDYKKAIDRMNGLDRVEGEINYRAMTPENAKRIIAARRGLTEARESLIGESKRNKPYEQELRTFIIGQKDIRTNIANDLRRTGRKALPDEVDRQALTFMRDYKGSEQELQGMLEAIKNKDVAALQARLDQVKNQDASEGFEKIVTEDSIERLQKVIPVIERALAPTPDMKAMDAEITKYAEATLEEAKAFGILDSSIPPDKYINHILREAEAEEARGGLGRPKLATSTPFARQRTYPTTIDAMIGGKAPRTLDALDAIAIYGDRHATAVATRLLATELKNTELGKWGTQRNVPANWVRLGEGKLFEYSGTDVKTGQPFTTALYVPKKIADALRPITDRKTLFQSPAGKAFRDLQSRLKAAWVGLAIFHGNALTHSAINNMGVDILKLAHTRINSPEFQRMSQEAAADGLITARSRTPFEVYRGLEGVSFADVPSRMDVVRNIYGIKQLNELAAKTTYGTFDILQTFFKVPDFYIQVSAWESKHPNATKQEYFAARRSIAKEVNAVYGGLNWEAMGWGPNSVELLRAIMLAPDWSFSNVYSLKYALPKAIGGEGMNPGGKAARMFWFRSAANGLAFTQAASLLISGQLSSNPTQVYLGKDNKDKDMYAQIFFAGAPKDFVTAINAWHRDGPIIGSANFLSYKLAPLVGTAERMRQNRDWSGKPIIKKDQSFLEKTGREALYAAEDLFPAPFAAKTAEQMIMDPNRDYTYKDFLLGLAGAPVYHRAPEQQQKGKRKLKLHGGIR